VFEAGTKLDKRTEVLNRRTLHLVKGSDSMKLRTVFIRHRHAQHQTIKRERQRKLVLRGQAEASALRGVRPEASTCRSQPTPDPCECLIIKTKAAAHRAKRREVCERSGRQAPVHEFKRTNQHVRERVDLL
jgi:hypothetical protein